MNKGDILKFWEVIKIAASEKKSIYETFKYQKTINNTFINDFFQNFDKEISLSNYTKKFKKYVKYINIIKKAFSDTFEFSGGKQFRFFHSIYVANLASLLSDELKISNNDKEKILIASIFHDIGKSVKELKNIGTEGFYVHEKIHTLKRHEDIGAEMVREILKNDYDISYINKIATAIEGNDSNSIYENVLHDADDIAELGYMGIWRTFYYNNCAGYSIEQLIDYWFSNDKKLKESKCLKFIEGKILLNSKIEFMDNFLGKIKEYLNKCS